jgi:hypothetical protein
MYRLRYNSYEAARIRVNKTPGNSTFIGRAPCGRAATKKHLPKRGYATPSTIHLSPGGLAWSDHPGAGQNQEGGKSRAQGKPRA